MRVIAIANQKGGTGKTTTTVNVAAAFGELGRRVLVVDLDPQGNASAWLGVRDGGAGLLEALTAEDGGSLDGLVRASCARGVEVIAASAQLARAERHLAEVVGGERVLLELLGGLGPGRWDYVLIDCPPALGQLTINALAAAGELLVPVEASTMAVAGLADLVRTVERARRLLNPGLAICGIFACRVDARTVLARDVVAALRERFPGLALATSIRETVRLREAWGHAQPILVYAPASSGAEDYRCLAREIAGQEARRADGRADGRAERREEERDERRDGREEGQLAVRSA
jgi:chromosome partitioning protein